MKSALKPAALKPAASKLAPKSVAPPAGYSDIRSGIVGLVNNARQAAARNVNALMTASYWEIGRRIVEAEQKGKRRAGYGEQLIERLSLDLTRTFGCQFYLAWTIPQTASAELPKLRLSSTGAKAQIPSRTSVKRAVFEISETPSRNFVPHDLAEIFALPWSASVRLLIVKDSFARKLYGTQALRA
jgi:DUF1016 N-terminal domain